MFELTDEQLRWMLSAHPSSWRDRVPQAIAELIELRAERAKATLTPEQMRDNKLDDMQRTLDRIEQKMRHIEDMPK